MGTEILVVSDRLLAGVLNGMYQGILITVLVALSFRALKRVNAATRHAVWLCTLVLLVLLVVAHCFFQSPPAAVPPGKIDRTAATPEQEIGAPDAAALAAATDGIAPETGSSGPERLDGLSAEQEQPASPKPDSLSLASAELPFAVRKDSLESVPPPDAMLRGSEPPSPSIAAAPLAAPATDDRSAWLDTAMRRLANPVSLRLGFESRAARIAGVILLGACLMLSAARLFLVLLRLRQIRKLKLHSFPASEAVNELFQGLVARLGVGRKVVLKTLSTSQSSFVLGFLHPVILLPAEQMEPAEAEQILRHELAHVRRRDDWANLLQHFILAAVPFHPAAWWISRRLSLEREIACDDYVLQSSAQPHAYALLLANLASRMRGCPPLLAPGASNNKTQLQQRIDMILDTRRNTSPRLAARWLTILASAAALFAVAAICLAPRIVLAQSQPTAGAGKTPGSLIDESAQGTPAVAFAAAGLAPEAGETVSANEAPPATPRPAAIGPGPKLKTASSSAVNGQPAEVPAPPTPAVAELPAVPAAPAVLTEPPAPRTAQGLFIAGAAPAPEPRPSRTPRPARTESDDSALEARLERLEKMVESLMARGDATPYAHPMKPSADTVGPVDRKEIAKIDAFDRHQADIERKRMMEAREMERIKEQAKREAARAADLAKPSAANAEKAARAEQKRNANRNFNKGSQKKLDELRRQLEILERERERLDRQIEQLERQQEQLDEQREEAPDVKEQSDASELNP